MHGHKPDVSDFVDGEELFASAGRRQGGASECASPLVEVKTVAGGYAYVSPRLAARRRAAAEAKALQPAERPPIADPPATRVITAQLTEPTTIIRRAVSHDCSSHRDAIRRGCIDAVNDRVVLKAAADGKADLTLAMRWCMFDGNPIDDLAASYPPWSFAVPAGTPPSCCEPMHRASSVGRIEFPPGSTLARVGGLGGHEPFVYCPWCRTETFRVTLSRDAFFRKLS